MRLVDRMIRIFTHDGKDWTIDIEMSSSFSGFVHCKVYSGLEFHSGWVKEYGWCGALLNDRVPKEVLDEARALSQRYLRMKVFQ